MQQKNRIIQTEHNQLQNYRFFYFTVQKERKIIKQHSTQIYTHKTRSQINTTIL
jgi:hypothetical protein